MHFLSGRAVAHLPPSRLHKRRNPTPILGQSRLPGGSKNLQEFLFSASPEGRRAYADGSVSVSVSPLLLLSEPRSEGSDLKRTGGRFRRPRTQVKPLVSAPVCPPGQADTVPKLQVGPAEGGSRLSLGRQPLVALTSSIFSSGGAGGPLVRSDEKGGFSVPRFPCGDHFVIHLCFNRVFPVCGERDTEGGPTPPFLLLCCSRSAAGPVLLCGTVPRTCLAGLLGRF